MEVQYDVQELRHFQLEDLSKIEQILNYKGFVYRNGDSVISFMKPLYLIDHPDGFISYQNSESSYTMLSLNMDTIQKINLYDLQNDRLWHYNGKNSHCFLAHFKKINTNWKLIDETKEINGLQCKRALLYNGSTNEVLFDIWYCPSIPFEFGLTNLIKAPGLVVYCKFPIANISYSLISYKQNEPLQNMRFWQSSFDTVTFENHLKK